ncbi:hypothetical protein VTJ04DRAFT_3455 [Mycothermus thermophilus]|uniref:uncharacterized protein n=1 Tax=Humicola insolens TaxID=85995 RepID=UPI00374338B6
MLPIRFPFPLLPTCRLKDTQTQKHRMTKTRRQEDNIKEPSRLPYPPAPKPTRAHSTYILPLHSHHSYFRMNSHPIASVLPMPIHI